MDFDGNISVEEAALLTRILDLLPNSVYWKDVEGRYLWLNEQARIILKEWHDFQGSIIGKTDFDVFPHEAAKGYREHDIEVMQQRKTLTTEESITLPSGEMIVQLSSKKPLFDDKGNLAGIMAYTVDITRRKSIEDELRAAKEMAVLANQMKGEFIRNMEHDMRTPISGVWGLSNYLWENETEPEKKEFLGDITQSSKELLDYCNGILDFSKIESGCIPVVNRKFDLPELVKSVVGIEAATARHRELNLRSEIGEGTPRVIIGDDYRLRRILMNLLSNAVKFTTQGDVSVSVAVDNSQRDSKVVILKLSVEDTGSGIPDDLIRYIYERFARGTPSNRGILKGLGLGLTIVRQFVHELEGNIEVKSKIGEGTLFVCTFPVEIPLSDDILT